MLLLKAFDPPYEIFISGISVKGTPRFMTVEKNLATVDCGAEIADVSYEAAHVASNASNLLLDREDLLWITGEAPQHVTVRLPAGHPPILFVGWHVWHDYLTNPKTMEIYSGVVMDILTPLVACTALPGAGTQLWELQSPIPSSHQFVKFRITATFGPGPTYLNSLALFACHPGARFRHSATTVPAGPSPAGATSSSSAVVQTTGATSDMSSLLKELDEDIRALHPIKALSPSRTALTYVPPPSLHDPAALNESPARVPGFGSVPAVRTEHQHHDPTSHHRINSLEQAVLALSRNLEQQREDISTIKALLVQRSSNGASTSHHHLSTRRDVQVASSSHLHESHNASSARSSQQVHVQFPEDALRAFVEEVLAPKLAKCAKRTEAKTLQRMDEHIHGVLKEIAAVVDERVKQHLHAIALDVEHPYHYHFSQHRSSSGPGGAAINSSRNSLPAGARR
jgi:hypothetical protein